MTEPNPAGPSRQNPASPAPDRGNAGRLAAIGVLGIVLLGTIIYLLVIAAGGADLIHATVTSSGPHVSIHKPLPWLIAALAAALFSLGGWALTERDRAGGLGAHAELERAKAALEDGARRLEDKLHEHEQAAAEHARALADAHRSREQLEHKLQLEQDRRHHEEDRQQQIIRGWQAERDWNRELREQIARLQRSRGLLGRHDDVREMVLELTMRLVDAKKGLLMSDRDSADGLEVVTSAGFAHDPGDSALANRFAGEVIERDRTIREDHVPGGERTTPADDEVENLLAIPLYLSDEFSGVIICANRDGGFDSLADEVLLAVGDHAGAVLQNSRLHGDLRKAYLSTISVLADAIELKDRGLRGHSDAVSAYVVAVADRMEFPSERREALIFASLLHDVGKLGISERILLKPGRLTPEEFAVIQLHPRLGYELVRQVPALADIAPAILHHHERYDGSGYPSRLTGQAIPVESRIISIADTFSAMTSTRPYSQARTYEEACAELERCAGGQFDPELVRLFVEEVRRHPPSTLTESSEVDADLELHRAPGELTLGGRSFAITDSLTLLYSHRHFHESAQAEAVRAQLRQAPFAVIVVHLVGLNELNHARSFSAGDDFIRSVADVASVLAPAHQAVAFRASGRRIALLVPDCDLPRAQEITEALYTRLVEPAETCAITLGTAVWAPGERGETVIARAVDLAVAAEPVGGRTDHQSA